ncbi:MAG: M23 family metallopeptidase, partial [Mariprofundaceae bacterium]|nr:M23 family metallopeptidase [Mariprofundaceae bacterium]
KFTRISSRFQLRRKHPVLGYTRAHRGVDYAAGSGTPIHAVGEGRVMFAGWKGGYGRFVLIQHLNSSHATAYGHMRRYGKGIRKGVRVRQGQVIGYVGMSGLATGPHLHFEFRVRGRAVNPLHIKRSPARPVPSAEMARFHAQAEQRLQAMTDEHIKLAWG